jgi:3-deoxy-D-arabino-heptulosonate 7-phosphate (DAHP) synthase class II
MTRQSALTLIEIAGYHSNNSEAMRVYTSHRISLKAYSEAIRRGQTMKKNGMQCGCTDCAV